MFVCAFPLTARHLRSVWLLSSAADASHDRWGFPLRWHTRAADKSGKRNCRDVRAEQDRAHSSAIRTPEPSAMSAIVAGRARQLDPAKDLVRLRIARRACVVQLDGIVERSNANARERLALPRQCKPRLCPAASHPLRVRYLRSKRGSRGRTGAQADHRGRRWFPERCSAR
jgi:hypothetical protein